MAPNNYSALLSVLLILLLHSYGVSKPSIKMLVILGSPLFSQAPSNISTLMAAKVRKFALECSSQVTGLSNGFSLTLKLIKVLHIVLHGAFSITKKSLLLNIQVIARPPNTLE
jgi:hypothetical protein